MQFYIFVVVIISLSLGVEAFMKDFITRLTIRPPSTTSTPSSSSSKTYFANSRDAKEAQELESKLIDLLSPRTDRGANLQLSPSSRSEELDFIESAVRKLEGFRGIVSPVTSREIDGCWKLLYTSSPGTNSPIQRTVTKQSSVSVYQVVNLINTEGSFLPDKLPDVSNTVVFGGAGRLRVTALASTVDKKLVEPREGDGKIFGLNIFGVSSTAPPRDQRERIDFAFQEASFEFSSLPIAVPYPVPFKLLGDEAKGWIDNTYLSANFRIARGNKGTLFILQRADPSSDPLAAIATAADLQKYVKDNGESSSPLSSSSSSHPSGSSSVIGEKAGRPSITSPRPKGAKSKRQATIIFPAQLGTGSDYIKLAASLEKSYGIQCYPAQLSRLDWPIGLIPSLISRDYLEGTLKPSNTLQFYFSKVDEAVQRAIDDARSEGISKDDLEINILAHSIGGWISRAWLSEWTTSETRSMVKRMVTLGSPHNPPPAGTTAATIDQTRGLLTYINDKFPGAYEKGVRYTSVIGSGVSGSLSIGANPATFLFSALAYVSYAALSGEGMAEGDGLIPISTSLLADANIVEIKEAKHSNFIPSLPRSIEVPVLWYGSEEVIPRWVKFLES